MPRRYPLRGWIIGILSGIIAVAALIIGSVYGNVHASTLNPKIIAWACAAGLVMFGILATARLSLALGHLVARQSVPAAEGAVRFISSAVGYLIVLFGTFEVLDVSVQRLLVGAGVAGVVLGIAAQQSLGNIFAGLVLIMARPFGVGDHIRIRSGALGGMFDAWVQEMSLTYVTVQTDDGQFKIPNTAMLAAGVRPGASRERHDHTGAALRGDAEHGTGQCGADKRGACQYIAAQHCGARCSAGRHCAGQHCAGQHVRRTTVRLANTGQPDAAPANTAPLNTAPTMRRERDRHRTNRHSANRHSANRLRTPLRRARRRLTRPGRLNTRRVVLRER